MAAWCLDAWSRHESTQSGADEVAGEQALKALQTAERRRDLLFDMREGEEITRAEFLQHKVCLDAEVEILQKAQTSLAEKAMRDEETLRSLLNYCSTAYARFTEGDIRST